MSLDRKIMQLEIELEAIKREKDKPKLKALHQELANLKDDEMLYKQNGKVKKL